MESKTKKGECARPKDAHCQRRYNICDGRLFSTSGQAEITIIHSDAANYRGTSFANMDFTCSEDMLNYMSVTHVSNVHSRGQIIPETIISQRQGHQVRILSPFVELESVGNEIAIYTLLEHHILTIDAVACLYYSTLIGSRAACDLGHLLHFTASGRIQGLSLIHISEPTRP